MSYKKSKNSKQDLKLLKLNNTKIHIISFKDLLKLNIEVPNIQRILNPIKVNEIIKTQIDYYKKYKHFNFLGVINIHYCKENKKKYLVDGQHRYNAA